MIEVNFTPWRERLRHKKEKQSLTILISMLSIVLFMILFSNLMLEKGSLIQGQRNNFLINEKHKLFDKERGYRLLQKEKKILLNRLIVIYKLKGKQRNVLNLSQVVFNAMLNGVKVKVALIDQDRINIIFKAVESAHIASFEENLNKLGFIKKPCQQVMQESHYVDLSCQLVA